MKIVAEQQAQVGLDIGVTYCRRVRGIEGAGYAERSLAGKHPGGRLNKSVARAEFGVAEPGPLGARRRRYVDVLKSGIGDRGQLVGNAVLDQCR